MAAVPSIGREVIPADRTGWGYAGRVVTLRLFAAARDAAGTGRERVEATTVGEAIAVARERFGSRFADVAATATIWVNGEAADDDQPLSPGDEVAVLPPVSGGSA